MNTEKTLKEFRAMKWEKWLERPFNAFFISFFEDSTTKKSFEEIGVTGVELTAQLYQNKVWYLHHPSLEEMDAQIEKYLASHTMFDVTDSLAKFKQESEQKITELVTSSLTPEQKLEVAYDILRRGCTYIWFAHGAESFYARRLKEEVPKYVQTDSDTFIGDASFPKKKNAHVLFEEMLLSDTPTSDIVEKYGWIKTRGDWSDGFTSEEIDRMRSELTPKQTHREVAIPEPLQDLFSQIQELVYFRTARTDTCYELFFKMKPIVQELAVKYGIPFNEMRYYRAKSFINGVVEKYIPEVAFGYLRGVVILQNDPIVLEEKIKGNEEIRGAIAFKGKTRGVVKIVKQVSELDKVVEGDILVTQMTFPSFIPAMIRAVAFVTDEGGITCHAAIVAREMRKPCIIGTKIATQVLKDGDVVEVDADNGMVRLLSGT